jgi:hypothetical protein
MSVVRGDSSITLNHSSTFENNKLTLVPDTNVYFTGKTSIEIESVAEFRIAPKTELEVINCQIYADGFSSTTLSIIEGTLRVTSKIRDDECYFTLLVPGVTIQLFVGSEVRINRYNGLTSVIVDKGTIKTIQDNDMKETSVESGKTATLYQSDTGYDSVEVKETSNYDRYTFKELD